MSIIVPSRHTGIGAWVNSNLYTSILYNFINFHARVLYKHRIHGKLGLQQKRLGGIKGCKVLKEKSERCITSRNGWVSLKGIFRWYICSLLYYI